MKDDIKKVILPIAGLGTRFLPLSNIVPKEIWPLVDKPVIQYLVKEVEDSGIKNIIFVVSKNKKIILDYFKISPVLKKILKQRNKTEALQSVEKLQEIMADMNFSSVEQNKPLGDGHAILQALIKIRKEPVGVLFGADLVESETPCIQQLINIYRTCQKPVLALYRVPKESLPSYGVVKVEKIAKRVYKIKQIIEKPAPGEEPSDMAIIGKYVLTPEVFDYLKTAKPNKKGEIVLAETLNAMIQAGKTIYGYEIEGKWLECGTKLNWLKSNIYLALKDSRFQEELKVFIKENNLIK